MNKQQALDYLGITAFHKAGYTGSRTKIVSDEKVCEKKHKDVISPKGFKSKSGHGDDVMTHIKMVAPDAMLIAYPFSGTFNSNGYKCDCAEYIKNEGVHVFTTSNLSATPSKGEDMAMQDCIDKGCIFFAAAGNDGDKGVHGESKSEKYLAIGGVIQRDGEWKKVSYSSVGEELDYVTIAEMLGVPGTSFCAPVFAGMVGLVQDFFIDKVGRPLTRKEMIVFINDNLIDVDTEGFDIRTGHGLFKLPNPASINVLKYVADINVGYIDYSGIPEIKEEIKMPIICLDYGHGKDTCGKRSPDGSLLEYEFNRDVGKRLKAILERHNIQVVETVTGDADVSLPNRCKIANNANCNYLVSLHANGWCEKDKDGNEIIDWNSANGWEILIVGKGGKAEKLAEKIREHSIKDLCLRDRGVKVQNCQILRDTNMPAVLIEHGFYTNKEECAILKTEEFRQKCAEADAKGILEFLGIEYEGKTENPIIQDWKVEQYQKALAHGIITDKNWINRLNDTVSVGELFAMLNNLYEKIK